MHKIERVDKENNNLICMLIFIDIQSYVLKKNMSETEPTKVYIFVSSRVNPTQPCVISSRRDKIQTFFDSFLSRAQTRWGLDFMKVDGKDSRVTHRHPSEVFTYSTDEEAEGRKREMGHLAEQVILITEKDYRRHRAKEKKLERKKEMTTECRQEGLVA